MLVRRLYSTAFWVFLLVSSLLLFLVAMLVWAVTAPFDRRRVVLHQFTCFWASLYTWVNPLWSVGIEGRERIDRAETYVIVANHLSLLDILVLFRLFRHFKWVSKEENFTIPFIGWNMRLNGYIPLRRGDRASVVRMMADCERTLDGGSSIMMFPEGTRSRTGQLGRFKPGSFELALRTARPVLPIAIEGTHTALPKRGFLLRGRHAIRVHVLDAIPPEQFAGSSAAELAERARQRIAHRLSADAAPLPDDEAA